MSRALNPPVLCAFGNVLQNQRCQNDTIITIITIITITTIITIIIPFVLSYAQMAEARCSKGAKKQLQIEVPLSFMRFNDVFELLSQHVKHTSQFQTLPDLGHLVDLPFTPVATSIRCPRINRINILSIE